MSDERPDDASERPGDAAEPPEAPSAPGGEHLDDSPHLLHHVPAVPQAHRIADVHGEPVAHPAREAAAEQGGVEPRQPTLPIADVDRTPRPLIERVGMAAIGLVLAALFGGVALAAFSGGEPFLGVMAAVGCLMTVWVGAVTLFRG